MEKIPLQKYLSHNGYGSRRDGEELIREGRVLVNGSVAELGTFVTKLDRVEVPDYVQPEITTWAFNKPSGIVTVNAQGDNKEIKDIVDIPDNVVPIGRLDKDSEGLILLSNDSNLPDKILGSGVEKEYFVEVDKEITHGFLVEIRNGVSIKIPDNRGNMSWYTTKKTKARRTSKTTFEIILTEGKNRQIRRMCASLGYGIRTLRRFRIGDIALDNLKPGEMRKLEKLA
jgi:23S rRNA pseudouridine2604 synthase